MENNNCIFSQKLNEYFKENIKLSFVSERSVIIVTKSDECYEFIRDYFINTIKNSLIAFSDKEKKIKSLIEKSFIEELSNKNVIDFKCNHCQTFARTFNGNIYSSLEINDEKKSKPKWSQILINENIIEMRCGDTNTLFLTINNDVYKWDDYQSEITLIRIQNLSKPFNREKFKSISCGYYYSIALTESDSLYSWRVKNYGQNNISNRKDPSYPELVKLSKQLVIKKISCGFRHTLLLSSDGDIYKINDADYKLTKIKCKNSEKFIDIASHYKNSFNAAVSVNLVYYIWGYCGQVWITEPKATELKSFNDIFEYYFQISYEPIEGKIIRFNDDFIQKDNYKKNFIDNKEIGKGSFGKVFEVKDKVLKNIYAIKTIKFKEKNKNQFMKELETLPIIAELRHENIVKYFDVWLENDSEKSSGKSNIEKNILYIQMELCDKALNEIIHEIKNDYNFFSRETLTPLGYYIASEIFSQILEGVNYLHKQNPPLIHRDLNPWNIMLKIDQMTNSCVKIVDLGLATIHEYLNQSHTQQRGHIKYVAPEVESGRKYDSRVDIYSLGLVLENIFQIDINRSYEENDKDLTFSLMKIKYENAIKICKRMTQRCSLDRPQTLDEILRDKDMWTLSESEEFESEMFNAKQLLNEVMCCDQNNESFVIKILKKRLFSKTSYEKRNRSIESSEYRALTKIDTSNNLTKNRKQPETEKQIGSKQLLTTSNNLRTNRQQNGNNLTKSNNLATTNNLTTSTNLEPRNKPEAINNLTTNNNVAISNKLGPELQKIVNQLAISNNLELRNKSAASNNLATSNNLESSSKSAAKNNLTTNNNLATSNNLEPRSKSAANNNLATNWEQTGNDLTTNNNLKTSNNLESRNKSAANNNLAISNNLEPRSKSAANNNLATNWEQTGNDLTTNNNLKTSNNLESRNKSAANNNLATSNNLEPRSKSAANNNLATNWEQTGNDLTTNNNLTTSNNLESRNKSTASYNLATNWQQTGNNLTTKNNAVISNKLGPGLQKIVNQLAISNNLEPGNKQATSNNLATNWQQTGNNLTTNNNLTINNKFIKSNTLEPGKKPVASNKLATNNNLTTSNTLESGNKPAASNKLATNNNLTTSNTLESGNKLAASNKLATNNNLTTSNTLESGNKPAASNNLTTNWQQTGNNLTTNNNVPVSNKLGPELQKIVNQLAIRKNSESRNKSAASNNLTTNWQQTGNKLTTNNNLETENKPAVSNNLATDRKQLDNKQQPDKKQQSGTRKQTSSKKQLGNKLATDQKQPDNKQQPDKKQQPGTRKQTGSKQQRGKKRVTDGKQPDNKQQSGTQKQPGSKQQTYKKLTTDRKHLDNKQQPHDKQHSETRK